MSSYFEVMVGNEEPGCCLTSSRKPPPRLEEDSVYWLDSSRIAMELQWKDETGLDEGIAEMVAWGRKYLDQVTDWLTDYVRKSCNSRRIDQVGPSAFQNRHEIARPIAQEQRSRNENCLCYSQRAA